MISDELREDEAKFLDARRHGHRTVANAISNERYGLSPKIRNLRAAKRACDDDSWTKP